MKILCINPPQKIHRRFIDYPPFTAYSLWYTAAYLRDCGYEVEVLDAYSLPESAVSESDRDYLYAGVSSDSFEKYLSKYSIDVALLHASQYAIQEPERHSLFAAGESIRRLHPEALIILADLYTGGMNYINWDTRSILTMGSSEMAVFDYILRYEVEKRLPELLEALDTGVKPRQSIIEGTAVAKLPKLESNPYEFVDMAAFAAFTGKFYKTARRADAFEIGGDCVPFKISRGCQFKCSFCSSGSIPGAHSAGWRKHSLVAIEKQLRYIAALKPRRRILLLDEAANSHPLHFEAFLDMVAANKLKLEIPNGLRADLLNFGTLRKLKQRISLLSISPECGNQKALDRLVGKKMNLESIERVAAGCAGLALPLAMHFIIGLPGETREELQETFDFARRMHIEYGARPWIQYAVPVPGTRLFDDCVKGNLLSDKLPNDLNSTFQGGPLIDNSSCGAGPAELTAMLKAFYDEPGMRH